MTTILRQAIQNIGVRSFWMKFMGVLIISVGFAPGIAVVKMQSAVTSQQLLAVLAIFVMCFGTGMSLLTRNSQYELMFIRTAQVGMMIALMSSLVFGLPHG